MTKNLHLRRRGTTLYWRRKIPPRLAVRFGKTEFVRSLGTGDAREAAKRARLLSSICDLVFEMVEANPLLTQREAERLARTWFVKMVGGTEARQALWNPSQPGHENSANEFEGTDWRKRLTDNDIGFMKPIAYEVLRQYGHEASLIDESKIALLCLNRAGFAGGGFV